MISNMSVMIGRIDKDDDFFDGSILQSNYSVLEEIQERDREETMLINPQDLENLEIKNNPTAEFEKVDSFEQPQDLKDKRNPVLFSFVATDYAADLKPKINKNSIEKISEERLTMIDVLKTQNSDLEEKLS